jgi:hypothetical protein
MSQFRYDEIAALAADLLSQIDDIHDQYQDHTTDEYYLHGPISFTTVEALRELVG